MKKFFKISLVVFLLVVVFSIISFYGKVIFKEEKEKGGVGEKVIETDETREPYLEENTTGYMENEAINERKLQVPLDMSEERVIKKPFGIFITPQNSPVSPERFSGYHTAADFEVLPEELEAEARVPVRAVCAGKLLSKRIANGYGGLVVQGCEMENQAVTVIYGHLKLSSVSKNIGENIVTGEELGFLGNGYSVETDGERKHLHLGIHKGSEINILGYVQREAELSSWIDPCLYFCGKKGE